MLAISHHSNATQGGPEEAEDWRGEAERCAGEAEFWQDKAERWRDQAGFWREKAEHWQGEAEYQGSQAEHWGDQAERLGADNVVLRARVGELDAQVGVLSQTVATLSRRLFGTSSERKPQKEKKKQEQSRPGAGGSPAGGGAGSGKPARGQRRGGPGHGRRDYSGLETVEELHDLPAEQRVCPGCGTAYVRFGEECCEQIDWLVRIVRIVHRRPTYRRGCRCAVRGVLAAPPVAKAISKGRFTTGFLARLLVEKFVLGRPTHRIVAALAADGLALAEGTLAGVFDALAELLAPLAEAIEARNAASAHLHVDETSWRVFAQVEGKEGHRWWCWVFLAPDTTVFRIAPFRNLDVLTDHLGITVGEAGLPDQLPGGRAVLLSSDFYVVYQALGAIDGVDNLWCWAHIRRYFIRAADANPQLRAWCADWLELIGALYAAHTAIGATEAGSHAHTLASAQFSAALRGIDAERKAQAQLVGHLHPAAAKVLATLDREWDGLARHKQFPRLPLDNNAAERALRGPVIGRKNYYGSGSVVSAELASRAWTITATAERAGYNPLAYLRDYLDACATAGGKPPPPADLARFLPWAATPDHSAAWRHAPAGAPQRQPDPAAPADTPGPAP